MPTGCYKNGVSTPADGDWYLRSGLIDPDASWRSRPSRSIQPGVPLYEAYAGVLQSFNELDTLQQRIGNRSWGAARRRKARIGRARAPVDGRRHLGPHRGGHAEIDPETSTTVTDYDVTNGDAGRRRWPAG